MKPFAIYFPQFYATTTNNDAWGAGFTDWSLVANANLRDAWPRRAPVAGFYDGSSPAVHSRQIAEALEAGIGGFGVYHYWFYTHQELHAFEQTLLGGFASVPPPPWFLIWASEGWSKRWLAKPDTLIHLTGSPNERDIERHCDHLATCFASASYMKWRGKPLFIWYNLGHFDEPESVVVQYREALLRRGFDIAVGHFVKNPFDLAYSAFTDASYLFEPRLFFGVETNVRGGKAKAMLNFLRRIFGPNEMESLLVTMDRLQKSGNTYSEARFLSYIYSTERATFLAAIKSSRQEVISPGWDNTPRYGRRFTALEPLNPSSFSALVRNAMAASDLPPLLNAWNEWSEGAAIEPCVYFGRRYLDALTPPLRRSFEG
jgi:Glycosyltransferase WbsX